MKGRALEEIRKHAQKYLLDVAYYDKNNTIKAGKILSFQYLEVACIAKGKVGKDREFGRVYQRGRIGGNFSACPSINIGTPGRQIMAVTYSQCTSENVRRRHTHLARHRQGVLFKSKYRCMRLPIKALGIQYPGNVRKQQPIP